MKRTIGLLALGLALTAGSIAMAGDRVTAANCPAECPTTCQPCPGPCTSSCELPG